ncbi:MAG: GAF domain-containing protein [Chloroflexi bacterium]|nr:GAF domain-containing protein [Chloroflexota bacterium]
MKKEKIYLLVHQRLWWLTVLVPAFSIAFLDYAKDLFLGDFLPPEIRSGLIFFAVLVGASFFSYVVFGLFDTMQREILRRNEELATLNLVGAAVSQSLDLDEILHRALEKVMEVTRADAGEIWFLDEAREEVVLKAHRGLYPDVFKEITRFRLGEGFPGRVAQTGETIVINDLPEAAGFQRKGVLQRGFRSFAGIPLKSRNKVFGVMGMAAMSDSRFPPTEVSLLTSIGNQIGMAIENAKASDQMQHLAILEERDRIAREMHDSFAQTLAYLNLEARSIEDLLAADQISQAQGEVRQMRKAVKEAYSDVREAIFSLKTAITPKLSLIPTLREYLLEFSLHSRLRTHLQMSDGKELKFSPTVEIQLLRIVQEALTNVRKHAKATQAWVTVEEEKDQVCITVHDNGKGFDPDAFEQDGRSHYGLAIMRERAESVGARLDIQSQAGQGASVIIELPISGGG